MKKNKNDIELITKEDTKIDMSIIPNYFYILNTFVLFSFIILRH